MVSCARTASRRGSGWRRDGWLRHAAPWHVGPGRGHGDLERHERVRASYRGNYGRLAQIKDRYDPDNTFHINQNIQPASGSNP